MLDQITPVIIAFNEEPNLARTLEKLRWAREVVVLDNFSSDRTPEIVASFDNTRLVQKRYQGQADNWQTAVFESGVSSDWVLALDADYVISNRLVEELRTLDPPDGVGGYRARFVYGIMGRPLRGSLYPPVTVLFQLARARYIQDGHTQRVVVQGEVLPLKGRIFHDDRKPLGRWLASQDRYARQEAALIRQMGWSRLGWSRRIRKLVIMAPFLVLLHTLIVKGAVLDGRAGWYYAFQRLTAELILSMHLLQLRLTPAEAERDEEATS
ncbi:MAG: glycosyltransferase family 2 protein [Magnetococcales bacterium]|nr:glycosyltransferase family 2 protein [Magnetococcales bacterium]